MRGKQNKCFASKKLSKEEKSQLRPWRNKFSQYFWRNVTWKTKVTNTCFWNCRSISLTNQIVRRNKFSTAFPEFEHHIEILYTLWEAKTFEISLWKSILKKMKVLPGRKSLDAKSCYRKILWLGQKWLICFLNFCNRKAFFEKQSLLCQNTLNDIEDN